MTFDSRTVLKDKVKSGDVFSEHRPFWVRALCKPGEGKDIAEMRIFSHLEESESDFYYII